MQPRSADTRYFTAQKQAGLTLVELLIALVLGLLVSAAIINVFLTSQRVSRLQEGGSAIQNASVYGMQGMVWQLRHTNLGNDGNPLNAATAQGGVVLTASDASATSPQAANVTVTGGMDDGLLTRSGSMSQGSATNKWTGISNTNSTSDQLTIQYTNVTPNTLYDCEGGEISTNARVIQRYYLKSAGGTDARKTLHLYCDAGRIAGSTLSGFGNAGKAVIENVDHFVVRLGVQQETSSSTATNRDYVYANMGIEDYMDVTARPFITSLKVAVLTRADNSGSEASAESFTMLGNTVTLKTQTNAPKYLRRVYESDVLLRNASLLAEPTSAATTSTSNTGGNTTAASTTS